MSEWLYGLLLNLRECVMGPGLPRRGLERTGLEGHHGGAGLGGHVHRRRRGTHGGPGDGGAATPGRPTPEGTPGATG
jgi:hypothetical protein